MAVGLEMQLRQSTEYSLQASSSHTVLLISARPLSRFVVTHELLRAGAIKPGGSIMPIANVGRSLDDLDVEDLWLAKRVATKGGQRLFNQQSQRDCTVIDAITMEFSQKYPAIKFFHLFPGSVSDGPMDTSMIPFPFDWVVWLGSKIIGDTCDGYAAVPVCALLDPKFQPTPGSVTFLGYKLERLMPGKWAQDKANREKLWAKLESLLSGGTT